MRLTCHLILIFSLLAFDPGHAAAGERGLLWRVVQTCLLNYRITGGSFPCLAVEISKGVESGYAAVRAPNEDVHFVVTPTVRTIGIEAERLRGPAAPDYFHDAWVARHFITDDLPTEPTRADLALAVNSRPGRSQDQLHIHVACIRPEIKRQLDRQKGAIRSHDWTHLRVLPNAPQYWAHFEPGADLAGINVFDRVADGLEIDADDMDNTTIVVVGAEPTGFVILARQRLPHGFDQAHGEALLDHTCAAFQKQ